jgi:hypothetical protein
MFKISPQGAGGEVMGNMFETPYVDRLILKRELAAAKVRCAELEQCKEEATQRVIEHAKAERAAKAELAECRAEKDRLDKRDLRATIELCYDDGINPFEREKLKVVDVSVSENCYVVESETVSKLQAEVKRLTALVQAHQTYSPKQSQKESTKLPIIKQEKCPDALTPDGPVCPRCGGRRGPSGVDGGSWVHY